VAQSPCILSIAAENITLNFDADSDAEGHLYSLEPITELQKILKAMALPVAGKPKNSANSIEAMRMGG